MFEGLLTKVLERTIRKGLLEVTFADGRSKTFGSSEPGYPDIAIRLTDAKVPKDLVSDPRLGAGEAYMDGRIVI